MSTKARSQQQLQDIINFRHNSTKQFVFLDGYTLNDDHRFVQKICYDWFDQDRINRRLAIICSMSSRGKTYLDEDRLYQVNDHFVFSWTLDEYLEAVSHDALFGTIKDNLDSSAQLAADDREELVKSKYHFAGGCSRFMFAYKTDAIVKYIMNSVAAVSDVLSYIKGSVGDVSNNVVNQLFCSYPKRGAAFPAFSVTILSDFAASLLAIKCGPSLVENLTKAIRPNDNTSLDGWLFELWFFALLSHRGVQFSNKSDSQEGFWPKSDVFVLQCSPSIKTEETWFKPVKWNQGGYDAICVDKSNGLVRLVQVTRGDSHSFKIEFFAEFLNKLKQTPSDFVINELEIVFLVPMDKLKNFQITQVTATGLLADFGWKKNAELDKVKIVGVQGWCTQ